LHKSLFLALHRAGLRSQEARSLKWDDIDFGHGYLRVADGKGGKQRLVPLSSRLLELLQEHRKESDGVFLYGTILHRLKRHGMRLKDVQKLPAK
jgi:integrase